MPKLLAKDTRNTIEVLIDSYNSREEFVSAIMSYKEKILINSDGDMYLIIDTLIEINNIMFGSYKIYLRKINVRPCEFDKILIGKDLKEFNLY